MFNAPLIKTPLTPTRQKLAGTGKTLPSGLDGPRFRSRDTANRALARNWHAVCIEVCGADVATDGYDRLAPVFSEGRDKDG
jgi:hypothetical protein